MSDETEKTGMALEEFSHAKPAPSQRADKAQAPNAGEARADHAATAELEAVFDVPVNIAAVLGRTHMEVSELLALAEGDVIELDRKVGEAIDIFVNNRLVARGEVVLLDERLGVTMTEIIKSERVV